MRNMFYIYASYLLIAILNFVVRRIFVDVLTVDYLGYDGLFTSVFSYLSISEMGIASIITYHMYSEIATENVFQIRKLLYIYKKIYRLIGLFVLVAGTAACFFIPLILEGQELKDDWSFIYLIYFLQLLSTLCTYFFAYRRILFVTHQRIYVCTVVDTLVNMVCVITKMIVLLKWRNYILYLLITIANNLLTNLIISALSRKEYPEITKIGVNSEDMKALNLFHEVKNMLVTKIATTVYGASDNIIITRILGIETTGLIENYRMITSKINELILSLFNSLQASIGNLVYDDDQKKGAGFFRALDLSGFYLGIVSASGLIAVGQPFVLCWLKKESLLLPYAFLIALSVNVFLGICNNPIVYFRNTLGHFEADRNYMVAAAITNIILSIVLGIRFGITGVMIGTVIGHILIYVGRTTVVYRYYLKEGPARQYLVFAFRFLLLGISAASSAFTAGWIGDHVPNAVLSLILSGLSSVVISTAVFIISSIRTEAFGIILIYAKRIMDTKRRRKKEEV
ncbi:MAG: oligosaccharide flippase family protein [Lachnospiraceae bacterium]|nr:oligosaccharide flippase family protein [Lachnospiraceae bacterium]